MTPLQSWVFVCFVVAAGCSVTVILGKWIDAVARRLDRVEEELSRKANSKPRKEKRDAQNLHG